MLRRPLRKSILPLLDCLYWPLMKAILTTIGHLLQRSVDSVGDLRTLRYWKSSNWSVSSPCVPCLFRHLSPWTSGFSLSLSSYATYWVKSFFPSPSHLISGKVVVSLKLDFLNLWMDPDIHRKLLSCESSKEIFLWKVSFEDENDRKPSIGFKKLQWVDQVFVQQMSRPFEHFVWFSDPVTHIDEFPSVSFTADADVDVEAVVTHAVAPNEVFILDKYSSVWQSARSESTYQGLMREVASRCCSTTFLKAFVGICGSFPTWDR